MTNVTNYPDGFMRDLNAFVMEVVTLDVRATLLYIKNGRYIEEFTVEEEPGLNYPTMKFLDLRRHSQTDSNYENHLKSMQQLATTELLMFSAEQITRQLSRLSGELHRFEKYYSRYDYLEKRNLNNQLSFEDLQLQVYPLFIIPRQEYGRIPERFLFDLNDAVAFKEDCLRSFIEHIQQVIGVKAEKTEEVNSIATFDKWFYDPVDIELCLEALRGLGVIDEDNKYMLGLQQKAAVSAWVSVLFKYNYIRRQGDNQTAPLLSQKIKSFSISGKSLQNSGGKLYKEYLAELGMIIPKKKIA